MRPVHEFKANFSQAEPTPTPVTDAQLDSEGVGLTLHEADSSVRNLCFVWEDGRKAFFNYAYLVSVDLVLTDTINIMLLCFSGQMVTLKGYQLGLLFDLLLNHTPKTITATHPRYDVAGQALEAFVIDILVKSD